MDTIITGETYVVESDPALGTVALIGILRLNGSEEYAPVAAALAAAADRGEVLLDLRELEFLNSSGIAMLSRFVIDVRNRKTVALTILGSRRVAWQTKSLTNLQRLMPSLTLSIE